MDPSSCPRYPYDPSDKFDDIISSDSASNQNQSFNDSDELMRFLAHADTIQSGSANWASNMPTTRIPTQRQSIIFDPTYVDGAAEQMMNSMTTMFIDNDMDDFPPTTSMQNVIPDKSEFPWGEDDCQISSCPDVVARSPVDGIVKQSNTYDATGIQYQPIPQPALMPSVASSFGSTQLAPYIPVTPFVPTSNCEPQTIKKSVKKKSNSSPSTRPASPDPPRMAEWFLRDENGRRRRPLLHEYIRLLLENRHYSEIAEYVDKSRGIFKFYQREKAAQLWGFVKGRNGASRKFCLKYH